jgi:hypothetical protein
MDSEEIQDALIDLLNTLSGFDDEDREQAGLEQESGWLADSRVTTYAEEMMLTRDKGLVLRVADGREFQITIIRSK